jgi:hypothetical protein
MKKRKLVIENISELIFSDEKIKINKQGKTFIFEIGKEITSDLGEAVAIMMNTLDDEHKIWNFELEITEEITPEKSLYWLTGGDIEWKTLENYENTWSESYLYFQEEFGLSIVSILKKAKKLNDIKEGFRKNINLPIIYEFALSKNLVK